MSGSVIALENERHAGAIVKEMQCIKVILMGTLVSWRHCQCGRPCRLLWNVIV